MAITISELLRLKSTQSFKLVAGAKGLSKQVDMIDMLDFGWDRQQEYSLTYYGNDRLFDERSFVISSLMFARENPNKLYETIVRLIRCGVVGLAYKTVFYHEMPQDVQELADRAGFVIFRIDSNVTYREIILDVSNAIKLNRDIAESAEYLSQLLFEKLNEEEVAALASKISPHFRGNSKIVLIVPETEKDVFSVDRVIRNFRLYEEYRKKVVLCGYTASAFPGIALIATMDEKDISKFDVVINNALSLCGIAPKTVLMAYSNIHHTFTALNKCVIEASEALTACKVLNKTSVQYNELGTLSLLIPTADNPYVRTYMQDYLKPILGNEESMKTAIVLVQANGDFDLAANIMCLHKNTLRYRINKIHMQLSPVLTYEAFYEHLAIAIKIYLICRARN